AAERWFSPGENIATYATLDELWETVSALLQDDDKRAQMAHSAREHVYAHHTYDQRVERFEQLISEIQQEQHER
ncbi:MAG: glycosyltransferase, partial [Chloroflexota bacterium]